MFLFKKLDKRFRHINEDILDLTFRVSKLEKAMKPAKKETKKGTK